MATKNSLFGKKLEGLLENWRKEVNIQNLSSFYVKGDALILKK